MVSGSFLSQFAYLTARRLTVRKTAEQHGITNNLDILLSSSAFMAARAKFERVDATHLPHPRCQPSAENGISMHTRRTSIVLRGTDVLTHCPDALATIFLPHGCGLCVS